MASEERNKELPTVILFISITGNTDLEGADGLISYQERISKKDHYLWVRMRFFCAISCFKNEHKHIYGCADDVCGTWCGTVVEDYSTSAAATHRLLLAIISRLRLNGALFSELGSCGRSFPVSG